MPFFLVPSFLAVFLELRCFPTGAAQPNASSINWSAGGQVLANRLTSACNTSQQGDVAIAPNSGASTDFILDAIGCYPRPLAPARVWLGNSIKQRGGSRSPTWELHLSGGRYSVAARSMSAATASGCDT